MKLLWSVSQNWLQGLTIIDLSSLLPSPFASHLLGMMGAKVIKVESPHRPDPARTFGHVPAGKTSSAYREINSNKELIWLDLKSEKDRSQLYELVKTSHGAIEGYRPDVRQRLGIEYSTLRAINAGFVLCSVAGYHPQGPYRNRAGHDLNFVARSGILDQTRSADGAVVLPGIPLGDIAVAYAAALRFACALFSAQQTGAGCHVEISIEEALIEIQRPFLREALEAGDTVQGGASLITGKFPCYGVYAISSGGAISLGALEEKFWFTFCETIRRPHLKPFQFATGDDSQHAKNEITKALAEKDLTTWNQIFSLVDCCVEPVLSVKDVLNGLQSP